MKDGIIQPVPAAGNGWELKHLLAEAVGVLVVGLAVSLVANQISPRGLVLARNYFPGDGRDHLPVAPGMVWTNGVTTTPAQLLAMRLREQGFQLIAGDQAAEWFRDPRVGRGGIVFVDARDESSYRKGHIPGACEFDPYRPEKTFAAVLPVCQAVERIVVYCNGGDCDDSESAAIFLRDAGIPVRKLFVFTGGMAEWTAHHLPVETGERSGALPVSSQP